MQYLQPEMTDAARYVQQANRKQYKQRVILDMDTRTMAELRRYAKAPPTLHKVMAGSLLLVGEDERATKVSTIYSLIS